MPPSRQGHPNCVMGPMAMRIRAYRAVISWSVIMDSARNSSALLLFSGAMVGTSLLGGEEFPVFRRSRLHHHICHWTISSLSGLFLFMKQYEKDPLRKFSEKIASYDAGDTSYLVAMYNRNLYHLNQVGSIQSGASIQFSSGWSQVGPLQATYIVSPQKKAV